MVNECSCRTYLLCHLLHSWVRLIHVTNGKQMQGLLKPNLVMGVDMCCLSPNIFLHIIWQKYMILPWPRAWADAKVQAFWETLVKSMKMASFICILQLTLLTIWWNLHTSAMTYLKQPQNEHMVRSWHILWSWDMCLPLPTALLLSPIQPNHSSQSMTSCTCHCKQCQDQPHHRHEAGRQLLSNAQ